MSIHKTYLFSGYIEFVAFHVYNRAMSEAFRNYLAQPKVTQAEVARAMGVSQATVSRWTYRPPNKIGVLRRLSKYTGISVDELNPE
jgi:transcriptional regulator with XRE-family HTH domain